VNKTARALARVAEDERSLAISCNKSWENWSRRVTGLHKSITAPLALHDRAHDNAAAYASGDETPFCPIQSRISLVSADSLSLSLSLSLPRPLRRWEIEAVPATREEIGLVSSERPRTPGLNGRETRLIMLVDI
jgi:hypothetical protein